MLVVVVVVIVVVSVVDAMGERRAAVGVSVMRAAVMVALLGLVAAASSSGADVLADNLSSADQVEALVTIRAALRDPDNVLGGWVVTSGGDPCGWKGVTCSDGLIHTLELENMNLSGRLSPAIGKLRQLRNLFLDHNSISGPIPDTIGGLPLLQRLDLSGNQFNGTIPRTLGDLRDLYFVKLSHNNLSGFIPDSLIASYNLFILDLSSNNLSGTVQEFRIKNVLLEGNPLLRYPSCGTRCDSIRAQEEVTVPVQNPPTHSQTYATSTKTVLLWMSTAFVVVFFLAAVIAATRQWRRRHQIFADIDDKKESEVYLGHVKRYTLRDIKEATNNFNPNNILGQGGFGIVYKGILHDGTIGAVKRLKEFVSAGENQFHTEVEVISLVVHRNLLNLIGFCSEDNERILVYPYMLNGTVSSKLQAYVSGRPALDWPRRKKIALGAARGLAYLHEHCDPKIIHRDIKASNILLDEFLEAIVADFGLAKLLGEGESRVYSVIRGTFGRIAPEYLMKGESSEKTDVFAYGLLLVELMTGRKTLEVHDEEHPNGGVVDWARKLLEEDQLSSFVDKRLRNNYDNAELKEMVQIALLCTMFSPTHRPRMSEIIRMLEGYGSVAEIWEGLKNVPVPILMPGTRNFAPSPANYSREDECSSVELEAVELSGPR
ncbi:hypothetical protein QYE76_009790 [Lolium multiflorum]|uniref:non-specific serine/threonine protein kinase n=1 Tax=Lolium multiflorum TaxID=4521 RepID=A0AAD8X196_LOLMU|nr:hypothetical protein QYE76_009790 [Lolium multiflorum]